MNAYLTAFALCKNSTKEKIKKQLIPGKKEILRMRAQNEAVKFGFKNVRNIEENDELNADKVFEKIKEYADIENVTPADYSYRMLKDMEYSLPVMLFDEFGAPIELFLSWAEFMAYMDYLYVRENAFSEDTACVPLCVWNSEY